MKIAEQVSSEVALLAEQLFSGRELKYLPLFCTLKNLMTSMWTVLCWCPRGITSVHGWQWSIVKFQQCIEKTVTEEGLPQVSSKMDHSFPYSYPSVSYPSVFTRNGFSHISPRLGHSPIPIHVFSRLVSEKERLIPPPPPPRYISRFLMRLIVLLTIVEMTAFFKRNEGLFGPKFYQMCLNCPTCEPSQVTKTFTERLLIVLTDSVGRCS